MTAQHVVVLGAGHAGTQLADSLRTEGFTDKITLVDSQTELPYHRPPLSKDFLSAGFASAPLPLRSRGFYDEQSIDLLQGVVVTGFDPIQRSVTFADAHAIEYTSLVFATGARNRLLAIPGSDAPGVHYLRDVRDARCLQSALAHAREVLVIGAGFIGLEFAAATAARGLKTTVVEYGSRSMGRAVSPEISEHFATIHAAMGVRLLFEESITRIHATSTGVTGAVTTTGETISADLILIGIGIDANDSLATAAGLRTDNGIMVHNDLRTSADSVYAIGDCARFPCRFLGAETRRESVQNAVDQAKTLARTLTGNPSEYDRLPWFWSNQGKHKLQIAGVSRTVDRAVTTGDRSTGKFSILRFDDDRLTCVESVNHPRAHMAARSILSTQTSITFEQAAADEFDLTAFAKHAARGAVAESTTG